MNHLGLGLAIGLQQRVMDSGPPPSSDSMITEDGDNMTTEDDNVMVTET